MSARTSIMNDEAAVRAAVESSISMKQAIEILGLRAAGGNYGMLKQACKRFDIDLPKYDFKANSAAKGVPTNKSPSNMIPNDLVFCENSRYSNGQGLKRRLLKLGVPNECNECGQLPVWMNKPLTLTLDHINGVRTDNRIENLRILCGHCHSQTATFCGRNMGK